MPRAWGRDIGVPGAQGVIANVALAPAGHARHRPEATLLYDPGSRCASGYRLVWPTLSLDHFR